MLFRALLLISLCAECVVPLGFSLAKARRQDLHRQSASALDKRDVDPSKLYPERNFSMPIDHFKNDSTYAPHSNKRFNVRYWFDASHYKAGGPVFILQGGETDASSRLPFLQKGIVNKVIEATNGLGVIFEHRYYGTSMPTPNLSVPNLRFLTTDQAMADMAYFAENVVFPGLEHKNLTSHTTPWIAYGGSYAGAFVAILRKLYPDTYFGAISSSGVTEAIDDYWAYYSRIAQFGKPACIQTTQNLTNAMDNILIKPENKAMRATLKQVFGLPNITHNDDFISTLGVYGIGEWQGLNWDPEVNDPSLTYYCGNVSSDKLLYPKQASKTATVHKLLEAGGYGKQAQLDVLTTRMLNWIGYAKDNIVKPCSAGKQTQDECYSTYNAKEYQMDSLDRFDYRSWPWQFCNQWGFYQTGSGVPEDQLPLMSRLVTLKYSTIICRDSFNITSPPDVQAINKHGGYGISYPRLAIVDGQHDPWREATPHAALAPPRKSTPNEPYYLIPAAVHHWDENSAFANETTPEFPPPRIQKIQEAEVNWVKGWLKDAKDHFGSKGQQAML